MTNVFDIPERFMSHPHIYPLQRLAMQNKPLRVMHFPFLTPTTKKNEYRITSHRLFQPWLRLHYEPHEDLRKRMCLFKS